MKVMLIGNLEITKGQVLMENGDVIDFAESAEWKDKDLMDVASDFRETGLKAIKIIEDVELSYNDERYGEVLVSVTLETSKEFNEVLADQLPSGE